MNDTLFRLRVDASEIAAKLGRTREQIEDKVVEGVEMLSIAAHAHIVDIARKKFGDDDFKREYYLGLGKYAKDAHGESSRDPRIDQTIKNVRWVKIADGMWMVELDERAQWLEEGRDETFMGDWLLKPGAKGVKRAKDGSLYRAIPFKQTEGKNVAKGANPVLANLVKEHARMNKISLTKIEKHPDGSPKIGVVKKLDIRPYEAQGYNPGLIYSKPRTDEDAAASGLKPHSGIFKLQGAVVVQRQKPGRGGKPGKVSKETVVFRVISTKHKLENRWMYPRVEPLDAFKDTMEWANKQWEETLKHIEQSLSAE